MKISTLLFAAFALAAAPTALRAESVCPNDAVFLALQDEVRGYPTRANGPTVPCEILRGTNTELADASLIAVSKHGNLHVASFQDNGPGSLFIFTPGSQGNTAPERSVSLCNTDFLAIAIDSHINDFVLTEEAVPGFEIFAKGSLPSQACAYYVDLDATYGYQAATGLAVDREDNLLIGASDADGNSLIATFHTAAGLFSPPLLRTITGAKTGLLPIAPRFFVDHPIQMSLAVDPVSGEIYAYSSDMNGNRQISVFPPYANGNVKPSRLIAGPHTQIGLPSTNFANKISVSADGRLFVAEANNRILVFAPGVSGDVAPAQIIQDSTIGTTAVAQGGIAVRFCNCQCPR